VRRVSLFSSAMSLLTLLALVWLIWVGREALFSSEEIPARALPEMPSAPEGSFQARGYLRTEYAQDYIRSYSVLGREQREELKVAPLTEKDWQPSMPVYVLAVLREGYVAEEFSGPAVNLGAASLPAAHGLRFAPNVVLVELVPAEPPGWWFILFGAAMLVFFLLGVRGMIKRVTR
jgi:hypothetical protein